jgi:hypothetical protein
MDRTTAHRASAPCRRGRIHRRTAALLALVACAVCGSTPAAADPPAAESSLTVEPDTVAIATGQCNAGQLLVRLTNRGPVPVYADAVLSASDALHLPRRLISTWLPVGYTRTVPVTVSAPSGTPAGTYAVRVTSGEQQADVPVTVSRPRPSPDLTRSAARVSASSSRAGYLVCGALDGDADPAHWGHGTGWADATGRQWPDWYQLSWDTPQQLSRVDIATVDSAEFPTERYGLRDWDVQLATADGWRTVVKVRGNTAATFSSTFPTQRTDTLRIVTYAANGANDQSRIVELTVF